MELVKTAIVRAKMCELLALETALKDKEDELFTLGLFSLLDAMLDTTMDSICSSLSLDDHLKNTLIHQSGTYSSYLKLVVSYEKGDKPGCMVALREIGLDPKILHKMYLEAISFSESVLG